MEMKDKPLLASYFALTWWAEAQKQQYFQSPAFAGMKFDDSFVKQRLQEPGQSSFALLMPSLYVVLVLSYEVLKGEVCTEMFNNINQKLSRTVPDQDRDTNYKCDKNRSNIQFIYHIRNAVAHASVDFADDGFIFHDKSRNDEVFFAKIPFNVLNWLVSELQKVMFNRFKEIQEEQRKQTS